MAVGVFCAVTSSIVIEGPQSIVQYDRAPADAQNSDAAQQKRLLAFSSIPGVHIHELNSGRPGRGQVATED
jgi:hypothetical protein